MKDTNKDWRNMLIFMGIVILIVIGFISQSENSNSFSKSTPYNESSFQKGDNSTIIKEFHWNHMPITFYIKESCKTRLDGRIEEGIYKALDFISLRTSNIVLFQNISSNDADIIFNCDTAKFEDGVLAEAQPLLEGDNIISSGEVFIYNMDVCYAERPTIFIHEIIHLFGIGHPTKTESNDVMREYNYGKEWGVNPCEKDITNRDANCLKYIYSNGKYGTNCSDVTFMNFEYEYVCDEGYLTLDKSSCCPEPNMVGDGAGYCVYPTDEQLQQYKNLQRLKELSENIIEYQEYELPSSYEEYLGKRF